MEIHEYPKEAIREALLNAVAHKDYSGGVPIQISVYKDKLMIWNEGQLPEKLDYRNTFGQTRFKAIQSRHCKCTFSQRIY